VRYALRHTKLLDIEHIIQYNTTGWHEPHEEDSVTAREYCDNPSYDGHMASK